jgi:hypothetical protein
MESVAQTKAFSLNAAVAQPNVENTSPDWIGRILTCKENTQVVFQV